MLLLSKKWLLVSAMLAALIVSVAWAKDDDGDKDKCGLGGADIAFLIIAIVLLLVFIAGLVVVVMLHRKFGQYKKKDTRGMPTVTQIGSAY